MTTQTHFEAGAIDKPALALRVREHVIRLAGGGGCFLGASLSCTDILVQLYAETLRLSPEQLRDPHRDVVLLSKGHDVPALYGVLAELGYIEPTRLQNHLRIDDVIYWHPNRAVPGVEFHSGSLGHLLSVGVGIAYETRLRNSPARIFVIVGDGELNEGSVWEALLVASAQRLDHLVVIVDRNGFQANMPTEALLPLEPLDEKFRAFGCHAIHADGHNFDDLRAAFATVTTPTTGRPTVIIAKTARNKGLPSLEGRAERWFVKLSPPEIEALLQELHGQTLALPLTSPVQFVR